MNSEINFAQFQTYVSVKDLHNYDNTCFQNFKINNSQNINPFNKNVFCHMFIIQNVTVNNYAI